MKLHAFFYSLFFILYSSFAFAQVPSTDIYLIKVEKKDDGFTFGEPKNITNREGYDNQPFFLWDGRTILYTSIREEKQADVYKYDIKRKKTKRVTRTPEDEYSPTLMPDGRHFSTVRVEKDSTQRLWKFDMKGRNPELILPDVKGIGYHAWKNDSEVVLFILGNPFSLQLANIRTGKTEILDNQIGRSIVASHDGSAIYYVSKKDSARWYIMELAINRSHDHDHGHNHDHKHDHHHHKIQRVALLPEKTEDFTMDWDNNFYSSCGGQLLYYGSQRVGKDITPNCPSLGKLPMWQIIHDLNDTPAAQFYRLAFSADMKYLAVVVYSGKKP